MVSRITRQMHNPTPLCFTPNTSRALNRLGQTGIVSMTAATKARAIHAMCMLLPTLSTCSIRKHGHRSTTTIRVQGAHEQRAVLEIGAFIGDSSFNALASSHVAGIPCKAANSQPPEHRPLPSACFSQSCTRNTRSCGAPPHPTTHHPLK